MYEETLALLESSDWKPLSQHENGLMLLSKKVSGLGTVYKYMVGDRVPRMFVSFRVFATDFFLLTSGVSGNTFPIDEEGAAFAGIHVRDKRMASQLEQLSSHQGSSETFQCPIPLLPRWGRLPLLPAFRIRPETVQIGLCL